MESSSSPWLSLALTVLEGFMTMRALTSNCRAADLGTDYSHPIIFGAPLLWKLTCKYAYRAFPEDGVVSHPHTSWPYTSPPHTTVMFILKAQHPLFMSFVLLNFSFFLPHLTNSSSSLEADFKGTFSIKEVEHTWYCLILLELGPDRHDSGGESDSWFWIRIKSDSGGD